MRIVLVSPGSERVPSGNGTTLRRLAHGLRAAGLVVTEIHLADRGSPPTVDARELAGRDLVHALHARKAGVVIGAAVAALSLPLVLSVTGTDVYEDLVDPAREGELADVLRSAAAILVPDPGVTAILARLALESRCVVTPKAIENPEAWTALRAPGDEGHLLFLHIGGWRAVKNQLFPLEPVMRLAAEFPGLALRFLGPVLEPEYHAAWMRLAPRFAFAEDLGVVDPCAMPAAMASASVVLNTSHSEGGANAILEAMASGIVVLASDVPGNAALVRFDPARWEDSTGVLYRTLPGTGARRVHDAKDFLEKARRLALDPELRARMGKNARRSVLEHHRPEQEIAAVLEAYRRARS
jgi:glycosyltransferase involved in cell wall biosynthesis